MQKLSNFFAKHGLKIMLTTIVLLVISVVLPVPYYVEQPGSAKPLSESVEVDGKTPDINGQFMITSVGIRHVNVWGVLASFRSPHQTLLTEDEALGGSSMQQDQALNALYMTSSINQAKVNAYSAADVPFKRIFQGIYVLSVQANSDFSDVLQIGDSIKKVDGKSFDSTHAFQEYIQSKAIGTKLTVEFERNGKSQTVTRKTMAIDEKKNVSGIGIILTEDTTIEGKPEIDADLGAIGGPSGGLMLTLEMYDALNKEDLARDRKIAGTGTIDPKGNIGEIGGIDKKIIAARDAGATIFLAPYTKNTEEYRKTTGNKETNFEVAEQTAKTYAPELTVVPVKTLQEAITYLRK